LKIVLATFNTDKLREMRDLLRLEWAELVGLGDVPGTSAAPEVGKTLEENALAKARAALRMTGMPSIADDTGLEVDALGGKPGVYTARFAGPGATYAQNVHRLLEVMTGIDPARRTARFRTVCVACFPGLRECVAEGVLEGRITEHPRGANGFGYDPVFEVAGLGKTLAELAAPEKNALSHRAKAAQALVLQLAGL
jgi:XTP/dITP diphosphohydrolase